jgi:glycine cleavage system H protein
VSHNIPSHLKFTNDHEWALIEGDIATIGITDFAQSQLGDVVFVELPNVGTGLDKGSSFGVVESIKSVSDLISPLSGEVIERNDSVINSPESCNQDAYGSWMIKLRLTNPAEAADLLDASAYGSHCS